jgi:hypothetical protein
VGGSKPLLFAIRYSPFTIRQSPVANHPQLTAVAGRVILFMAKEGAFEEGDEHAQVVRFLGIDGFERDT